MTTTQHNPRDVEPTGSRYVLTEAALAYLAALGGGEGDG